MYNWKVFLVNKPDHFAVIKAETSGKAKFKFAEIYGYRHLYCNIRAQKIK